MVFNQSRVKNILNTLKKDIELADGLGIKFSFFSISENVKEKLEKSRIWLEIFVKNNSYDIRNPFIYWCIVWLYPGTVIQNEKNLFKISAFSQYRKKFCSNRKQVLKKERSFFSWGCTDKTNEKPAGSGILFDSLASVGEQLLAKLLYRSHTGRHHRLKSTTIAKDFRPTAMVGKVWVHSYGHR